MKAYKPRRGRILENGPHRVEVTTYRAVEGRTGRKYEPTGKHVVSGVLVEPASGSAQSATEKRNPEKSLVDETTLVIMGAGRWPGGPHSTVKILEGPAASLDYTYQQTGDPGYFGASPMVAHFTVRVDLTRGEVK